MFRAFRASIKTATIMYTHFTSLKRKGKQIYNEGDDDHKNTI
jgi:hypothetical protein